MSPASHSSLFPSFIQWSRSTTAISFRLSQMSSRNLKAPKRSMPNKGSGAVASSVTSAHSTSVNNTHPGPVPAITLEGLDSIGSSSRMRKTLPSPSQVFLESGTVLDGERSKENVTVTVRFRPLRCGTELVSVDLWVWVIIFGWMVISGICVWAARGRSGKERKSHGMPMGTW